MEQGTRAQLVERYKEGTRVFAEALEGITDTELDARPGPEEWTAREVVHHMADSEMTSAIRLRRLIAEDAPTIQGYDQEEYAQRLFYAERPIEPSLEAVSAARRTTGDILDRLTQGNGRGVGRTRRAVPTAWRRGSRSTRTTPTTTRIRSAGLGSPLTSVDGTQLMPRRNTSGRRGRLKTPVGLRACRRLPAIGSPLGLGRKRADQAGKPNWSAVEGGEGLPPVALLRASDAPSPRSVVDRPRGQCYSLPQCWLDRSVHAPAGGHAFQLVLAGVLECDP